MTSTIADLQRRNLEKMTPPAVEQPSAEPSLTEARTYGNTEVLTEGRTDAREEVSTDASPPARKPARKEARTDGRKAVSADAPKPVNRDAAKSASMDGLMEVVEATLTSREPLIGGVKATVDMSPALSTRAKRYLADHRGQNTRQVLIALFDAFLTAKGY